MNALDFILVGIVVLGGWNGYRTGLFRQVTRLFGAVIAYFVSMWLKPYVAPAIRDMHIIPQQQNGLFGVVLGDFSDAAAFVVVFGITFILLRYAAGLVDALFSLPVLSTVNRLAGLAAGLILAVVFIYVATLVAHYVTNPWLQRELHTSTIVNWLDANKVTVNNRGNVTITPQKGHH